MCAARLQIALASECNDERASESGVNLTFFEIVFTTVPSFTFSSGSGSFGFAMRESCAWTTAGTSETIALCILPTGGVGAHRASFLLRQALQHSLKHANRFLEREPLMGADGNPWRRAMVP